MSALHEHHVVPYRTFIGVWLALLGLTGLLLGVSALHLGDAGILATLVITPVKAALVLYYFMHLKYESTTLKAMALVGLSVLVVLLGLMMIDFPLRPDLP